MVIQFPANPAVDTHYYASNKIQYVWDGEKWTSLGAITMSSGIVNVGADEPTNAVVGLLWYDTTAEKLKVRVGNAWKDAHVGS